MKVKIVLTAFLTLAIHASEPTVIPRLSLEDAFVLAAREHPALREGRGEAAAATARRQHAGRLTDPKLVARMESAPLRDRTASDAEYVAGISQEIPIGGRLGAARNAATLDLDRAKAGQEVTRVEIQRRLHSAFAAALYADQFQRWHTAFLTNAQTLKQIVHARVELGDASREDLARAELEAIQSELEHRRSLGVWNEARLQLAHAIGNPNLQIESLEGSLSEVLALSEIEAILTNTAPHDTANAATLAAQKARVELAKRERIPDVNLDLFYRRLQSTQDDAFDAGVSVAIPLFSRGKARVREAQAELELTEARLALRRNELEVRNSTVLNRIRLTTESTRLIEEHALPRARSILETAEKRLSAGDISLSEVLAQRRQFASLQLAYLESLRDVLEAWAGGL